MAEIHGIDSADLEDWDFEKAEKTSNWNGRIIKRACGEQTATMVLTRRRDNGNEQRGGVSIEGRAKVEWGGKDGVQWSAGAEVRGHDNKGNSGGIAVEQDSEGKTSVEAHGKSSSDENSK